MTIRYSKEAIKKMNLISFYDLSTSSLPLWKIFRDIRRSQIVSTCKAMLRLCFCIGSLPEQIVGNLLEGI